MSFTEIVKEYDRAKEQAASVVGRVITKALENNIPVDLVITNSGNPKTKEASKQLIDAWGFWGQHHIAGKIDPKLMFVVEFKDLPERRNNNHLKVMFLDLLPLTQS